MTNKQESLNLQFLNIRDDALSAIALDFMHLDELNLYKSSRTKNLLINYVVAKFVTN